MGFRLDIKPAPFLELGASRSYQLGGRGSGVKGIQDLSFNDWIDILFRGNAQDELNVNQIAGLDASLYFDNIDQWVPILKSIELWGEYYGEDEAGGWISHIGWVAGLKLGDILLTGKTDLILEYANNVVNGRPNLWYTNSIYQSGYTYKGEIMGHNMGSDARDYYVRLEHYLFADLMLGLDFNRQDTGVEYEITEKRTRGDLDVTWQKTDSLRIQAGYRFENIDNLNQIEGKNQDNHILWLFVDYSF
jgi:hypothetical protein